MRVKAVQYQRNGISGRPFFAAIVEDPFMKPELSRTRHSPLFGESREFLVISLDTDEGKVSPTETFVIHMDDLCSATLTDKWRGDKVPLKTLRAIRRAEHKALDARLNAQLRMGAPNA